MSWPVGEGFVPLEAKDTAQSTGIGNNLGNQEIVLDSKREEFAVTQKVE